MSENTRVRRYYFNDWCISLWAMADGTHRVTKQFGTQPEQSWDSGNADDAWQHYLSLVKTADTEEEQREVKGG